MGRGRGVRCVGPPRRKRRELGTPLAVHRSPRCRRADAWVHLRALPHLPQHHWGRLPRDLAPGSRRTSRSRSTRCQPEPRSLTGRFHREWNIRDAWVKNANGETGHRLPQVEPPRGQLQRPDSPQSAASRSCGSTCTRSPTGPTGSPIARPTTRRTGASAWRTASSSGSRMASTKFVSTPASRMDRSPTASISSQGSAIDEILLSCHACHPSLCNDNLSGVALVTQLAKPSLGGLPRILLPLPLHSRDHRLDHLARP